GVEQVLVALVAQHGQAGLLVQYLAAERIDHADLSIAHRVDHRLVHATALDEFRYQHPLVDQVHRLSVGDEAATGVLDFARIGNDAGDALASEVVPEEDEFAVGGDLRPVKDADTRQVATA